VKVFIIISNFHYNLNFLDIKTSRDDEILKSRSMINQEKMAFRSHSINNGGNNGILVVVDGTQARLIGLNSYTNYSVSISAATSAGVGISSSKILCTTMEDGKLYDGSFSNSKEF